MKGETRYAENGSKACQWRDGDLFLQVYVRPGAKQDGFDGMHDGAVKWRIKAPPAEGKANARLLELLAEQFGVRKSAAQLVRGETSRRKTVRISKPEKRPAWIGQHSC